MFTVRLLSIALLLVGFILSPEGALAWKVKTLYSTPVGADNVDGYIYSGLTNVEGSLFGTTYGGPAEGDVPGPSGTVFQLTRDPKTNAWSTNILYTFQGGSDGEGPNATMIDVGGVLYGTTYLGGGVGCGGAGCGTVFKLTYESTKMVWTESVVYSFAGGNDGFGPSGLIEVNGVFYGTTAYGGGTGCYLSFGCGTVFTLKLNSVTGAWTERVLHRFDGSDGSNPSSRLTSAKGFQYFYGTTYRGGAGTGCVLGYGCGTVFEINCNTGAVKVLHSFSSGGSDGASPQGALIEVAGTLYGTADLNGTGGCPGPYGCGTVFAINLTTGALTPLHEFTGGDGQNPVAALLNFNGTLYGVAGGGAYNAGEVFEIDLSTGLESVIYNFSGADGYRPYASLIRIGNAFYSTTFEGGLYGYGTVFELSQ